MNKIPGKMKLLNRLISLSAAGLLVGTAGAYAAGESQSTSDPSSQHQNQQQVNAPRFSEVDQNQDQRLVWTEIYAIYDDELNRAGWQEQDVMDQHDRNQDAGLDADEYVIFITTLAEQPGSSISQAQAQSQNQELSQSQSPDQNQSPDQGQELSQTGSSQSQSDQQAMEDQELLTDRSADPGSAEYYDEQDTDAVAESYEQETQDAGPADIASDQQEQDQSLAADQQGQQQGQGQDEMAGSQGQQSGQQQDQELAGSTGQGNQGQQSGTAGDQAQADGTTTTIIAITDVPDLTAEDLEDRHVVNLSGEDIGEVEEVIFGADGAITGLVVGVGGFWDIGDKDVYANASEIRVSGDELVWETTLDEESLEELPEYEAPTVSAIE